MLRRPHLTMAKVHDEKAIVNFHRFSIVVWAIWLVPYFSGVIMGMRA